MACVKKKTTDCFKYCIEEESKNKNKIQLLYSKFEGNAATKWGLLQEQPTKAKYLEEKRDISSPDYTVIQSSLTVRVDCP